MRRICFILTTMVMLVCITSNAQTATQARKVLDKTAALVGRKGGASASFTLKSTKYGNPSGTISIKGNKFRTITPQAKVWYDGKTQWSFVKQTGEVNISTPNEAQQMSMNPYKFITMYKNGYNLSMKNSGGNHVVHLVATNKQRSVQELYITISSNYQPKTIKMRQGNVWTTITITNFSAKNQDDAIFRFPAKEFKGYEVIDLR